MRPGTLLAALTALILAACDVVASPPPPVTANFTLASQGMLTNGNTNLIGWGTDEPNFIQIMVQMTGNPPTDIVENTECGAGPMRMASFPGGLVLNFQSGGFVGWTSTDPGIPVEGGLRPGLPAPSPAAVTYTETTLGTEFQQGGVFGS